MSAQETPKATLPKGMEGESELCQHVYAECEAMVKFALGSGLRIPAPLVEQFDFLSKWSREKLAAEAGEANPDAPIPKSLIRQLAVIHMELSEIVRPATPRTILLLHQDRNAHSFLGPVPLIRRMMVATFVCLVVLIAVSLSPSVDGTAENASMTTASGIPLLLNELFFLMSAAIGAAFFALFQANKFIAEGTFDPKYESSYWIRFVLGMLAGFMLAELIPIEPPDPNSAGGSHGFARPVLAMLGGFSSSLVYRILSRLVDTVESLVRGDTRDIVASREAMSRAAMMGQMQQSRMAIAGSLAGMMKRIGPDSTGEDLRNELDTIFKTLTTDQGGERFIDADREMQELGGGNGGTTAGSTPSVANISGSAPKRKRATPKN